MLYDAVIIGGGPAGMMAAIRASERGARVLLLEKNESLGLKLLATGHGRCNLTNIEADSKRLISVYGSSSKFLYSAFSRFGVASTVDFFSEQGVETIVADKGRVFPRSNRSADVLAALIKLLKKNKVNIMFNGEVSEIVVSRDRIEKVVLIDGEEVCGKNFVIATGGKSYPLTGSTGSAYAWLGRIGHRIISPRPALVPLRTASSLVKKMEGSNFEDVEISVYKNDKKVLSVAGDIVFTGDGVSGPAIIDLSSRVGALLPSRIRLEIDFKPEIDIESLEEKIQVEFHSCHNKMIKNCLANMATPKLLPVILELSGIDGDKKVSEVAKKERRSLVLSLKKFNLEVRGLKDFDKAMVTAGGVDVREVNPKTMRSRLYDNLYLAGEILDLDGPSGGFNLQICWSTGYVAGDSMIY